MAAVLDTFTDWAGERVVAGTYPHRRAEPRPEDPFAFRHVQQGAEHGRGNWLQRRSGNVKLRNNTLCGGAVVKQRDWNGVQKSRWSSGEGRRHRGRLDHYPSS
jgi:hypothetical protein